MVEETDFPTYPLIIFMSGEHCLVTKVKNYYDGATEFVELGLVMKEVTKLKYNLKPDRFDYNHSEFYNVGVYTASYPKSSIVVLSPNPADPLWLCLKNFDGSPSTITELSSFLNLQTQLESSKQRNILLESEIETMRIEQIEIAAKLSEFQAKYGSMFDSSDKLAELLGKLLKITKREGLT